MGVAHAGRGGEAVILVAAAIALSLLAFGVVWSVSPHRLAVAVPSAQDKPSSTPSPAISIEQAEVEPEPAEQPRTSGDGTIELPPFEPVRPPEVTDPPLSDAARDWAEGQDQRAFRAQRSIAILEHDPGTLGAGTAAASPTPLAGPRVLLVPDTRPTPDPAVTPPSYHFPGYPPSPRGHRHLHPPRPGGPPRSHD